MVPVVDPHERWRRSFFAGALEPNLNPAFICRSGSCVDNACVKASRHTFTVSTMLVAALALPAAWASDQHDHERARAAVQAGEVMPLPALLERVQRAHPGQVLELELEREGGRWIYEVKLLQAGGQLIKLELDAKTGQVLRVKGKDPGKDERKRQPS